jgi:hypothetical protein
VSRRVSYFFYFSDGGADGRKGIRRVLRVGNSKVKVV